MTSPESKASISAPAKDQRSESKAPSPPPKKKTLTKDLLRVVLISLVFVVAAYFLKSPAVRENLFNVHTIRDNLHPDDSVAGQLLGYLLFLVSGALLVSFGMPRIWVSAVAGGIYGAVLGTPLALVSTLIGSLGTYFIGRSMLRGVVRRRLGKRINVWAERFRENAFMWTLYARLFPLANATLTSVICGCCRVPVRTYLAANFLGFIPLTIVFAVFGSGATKGNVMQLSIGSGLFLVAVAAQWWYTRRNRAAMRAAVQNQEG